MNWLIVTEVREKYRVKETHCPLCKNQVIADEYHFYWSALIEKTCVQSTCASIINKTQSVESWPTDELFKNRKVDEPQ